MNRPEAPTEFRSIKCSLNTIAFNQDYRENLNRYITIVNDTTMHAFSLLKFILLDELQRDPAFDPFQQGHEQLSVRFFHEVWLSLINRVPATTMSTETAERRAVIQPYNEQYTAIANYTLPTLTYSQQAAEYESEKMLTAYLNNIKNNFGNQLRRAVNLLLNVKPRIDSIRLRAMVEQQRTGTVIDVDARIREQVTGPATAFKLAIANRTSVAALRERFVPMDPLFHRVLLYLRPFLESYPQDYAFAENNIYYDCKANPARHFKAYYCLAMVFE
ncbi:hypothetical protein MBANPS3_012633, partial [Mucor bainieri]